MNDRLLARTLRRGLTGAALMTLAVAFVAPPAAPAQTLEQLVLQRRLELRTARGSYETALLAFRVFENQFSQALTEVRQARQSGDAARLERASAQAQERSVPYGEQERRLAEASAAVGAARRALIDAITARMSQLVAQMDAAPSAEQRNQLDVIFRDLSNELQRLEAEEQETFRIDPVVLPEISFDPRDGPDELAAKAEILERQASVADSTIRSTQSQIQALNDRLRIQRQRRDFVAGTDRFDDTRVPVVTGAPPGERTSPTDSTVAGARPLTLEERIQILRDYILQLESYRDALLARASQFRRRVGPVA